MDRSLLQTLFLLIPCALGCTEEVSLGGSSTEAQGPSHWVCLSEDQTRPVEEGDFLFSAEEVLAAWGEKVPNQVDWSLYSIVEPPSELSMVSIQAIPTGEALYTSWNSESVDCGPPAMRIPADFSLDFGGGQALADGGGWIQATGLEAAQLTWISEDHRTWHATLPVELSVELDELVEDLIASGEMTRPSSMQADLTYIGSLERFEVGIGISRAEYDEESKDTHYGWDTGGLWAGLGLPR